MALCSYWGTWNFAPRKEQPDIDFEQSEEGRNALRQRNDARHRIELLNEERQLRQWVTDLW